MITGKDRRPEAATIRQVARLARVSPATVSRALAGSTAVSPELTQRVVKAADALFYRPNAAARGLRTGRSWTIGLVVPDIQNPFFTSVIAGIEQVLQAAGYSLLLANAGEQSDREQSLLKRLRADRVEGILMTPIGGPDACYRDLIETGIPVVAFSRTHRSLAVDTVTVDNQAAVCGAITHLITLGHRRIALITGPSIHTTAEQRLNGYREAHRRANIAIDESLVYRADFRIEGGFQCMMTILSRRDRPSAVLVGNNLMTLGALQAIHATGCKIPADMALIGFDDMSWAAFVQPPLTAIAQPTLEIGQTSAILLLERLRQPHRPIQHVVLETRLIVRSSCGALNASSENSQRETRQQKRAAQLSAPLR